MYQAPDILRHIVTCILYINVNEKKLCSKDHNEIMNMINLKKEDGELLSTKD